MFISWAVTSYQSNGARCDFSLGISVCLIEILYPIRRSGFADRRAHPARDSHASHSFLRSSLFRFRCLSFSLSLAHSPVSSFRLVRRARFAPCCSIPLGVLSLFVITPSLAPLSFATSKFPSSFRQCLARLSFDFIGSNANRYCVLSVMLFIACFVRIRLGREVTENSACCPFAKVYSRSIAIVLTNVMQARTLNYRRV